MMACICFASISAASRRFDLPHLVEPAIGQDMPLMLDFQPAIGIFAHHHPLAGQFAANIGRFQML
jgi:hypothetical protein